MQDVAALEWYSGNQLITESYYAPILSYCESSSEFECVPDKRILLWEGYEERLSNYSNATQMMVKFNEIELDEPRFSPNKYFAEFAYDGAWEYVAVPFVVEDTIGEDFNIKHVITGLQRLKYMAPPAEDYADEEEVPEAIVREIYRTYSTRTFLFDSGTTFPILQLILYILLIMYTCGGRTGQLPLVALQWNTGSFAVMTIILIMSFTRQIRLLQSALALAHRDDSWYPTMIGSATASLILGLFCAILYVRRLILGSVFSIRYIRTSIGLALAGAIAMFIAITIQFTDKTALKITRLETCRTGSDNCYIADSWLLNYVYAICLGVCSVLNFPGDYKMLFTTDPRRSESQVQSADQDTKNLTTFEHFCVGFKCYWNIEHFPRNIVIDTEEFTPIETIIYMGFIPDLFFISITF